MKRLSGLISLFVAVNLSAEETLPTVDCVISPSKVVDVGTAVSGVIEHINVGLGDRVANSQLLVELEAGVEKATVKLAAARASMKADLSAEKVNLRYDRLQEKRVDQLANKQLASAQNQDEASRIKSLSYWRTEQVREELHLRELELARAKAQLQQKRIYSVIDGVVAEQFKQEGEYVEDQPILRLVQLNPLHVNAVFPMHLYQRIQVGMQAEIFPETDQKQGYPVVVDRLDPIGDAASGTFGVRLTMDNSEAALPAGLKCFLQVDEESVVESSSDQDHSVAELSDSKAEIQGSEQGLPYQSGQDVSTADTDLPAAPEPTEKPLTKIEAAQTAVEKRVVAASVENIAQEQAVKSNIKPDSQTKKDQKDSLSAGTTAVAVLSDQTLGPYTDKDRLYSVTNQLDEAHLLYSVKEEQTVVTKGYIVLSAPSYQLPPSQLYRAFQKKGVTDMMRLPRKSYQGRISFGTYKGPVQATKRKKELALKGIDTQLVERKRKVSAYWVSVPQLPADLAIKN